MKQLKSKQYQNTALIYTRLSRDDNQEGDSYSIQNQRKLLTKIAKEKGYSKVVEFSDDGISGVTMNRPGFNEMLEAVENGVGSAVIVKDLSRLGRNYIEVGKLTEEFFPEHNIRLIAVSDNMDTDEGEHELAPIKNLFNEWYSRDISKKRRISNKIKGASGEPMGPPPYGYIKDPDNPKRWIIDKEAAEIVRRIFDMTLDGLGSEQIATALSNDRILTPIFYWRSKGLSRAGKVTDRDPYRWNNSSVIKILKTQEYCGDLINFKTYSKSYKNKKRLNNDPENMAIFRDVHEPIVGREVWEQVQLKRNSLRKRVTNEGEKNMFSGFLRCADCGKNMWYHFNQGNPEIKYFNCSNYKGNRGTCDKTHYIRVDFLEQVVLGEIRRLTRFASSFENEFIKSVIGQTRHLLDSCLGAKEKELRDLIKRDNELDRVIERLYEDNVFGKLSDERFAKMKSKFETEQAGLSKKIKALKVEIDKASDRAMTTDIFIETVRKYTRARKLTERMLNDLIEYIEVHHATRESGIHRQKLTIHYNCVGSIEIPNNLPIPMPEIEIGTRQGVAVSYQPNAV